MKIVLIVNSAWNVINFRRGLIQALIIEGAEIVVVSPADEHVPDLIRLGVRHCMWGLESDGKNPLKEGLAFLKLFSIIRSERPDILLTFTVKPNIYGGLIGRLLKINRVPNITGLGATENSGVFLKKTVRYLSKFAFTGARRVFFQNREDLKTYIAEEVVMPNGAEILPGSGVNLAHFRPVPFPVGKFRFLLAARLLWSKGIREYIDAIKICRTLGVDAEFSLLGALEEKKPGALSRDVLSEWVAEGIVDYGGYSPDVRKALAQAHCVVLPTYYPEGTPKIILEAAAMGRPVITTDTPGCRDAVVDKITGRLCVPRDPADLARKMCDIFAFHEDGLQEMGRLARLKIEEEYSEEIVATRYLRAIWVAED